MATQSDKLSFQDVRTLGLAALGGALEFYDFIIFVYFTKILSQLFFPTDMPTWLAQLQVYGIFAAGYLARPLGGIVMAHFGDKIGRKKMFSFSVTLMALPTLVMGLMPTYENIGIAAPLLLLTLRIIQGIAIGGEIPAAWVFVSEHVPVRKIGLACASLTTGLTVGIVLGSSMASWCHSYFAEDVLLSYGWRFPFIVGGIFGFFAVWLRKWLHETPVFEALKLRKAVHGEVPLKTILNKYRLNTLLSMGVTWTLTAGIVVLILMTPTIAQTEFKIPAALAFKANTLASLCLAIGCLVYGFAADYFGYIKVIILGSMVMAASALAMYLDLMSGGVYFTELYCMTGFFVGVVGVIPCLMVRIFPAEVRFTGVSLSYNMAYATVGAITAPLTAYLTAKFGGMAPVYYASFTCLICLGIGLYQLKNRIDYFDSESVSN